MFVRPTVALIPLLVLLGCGGPVTEPTKDAGGPEAPVSTAGERHYRQPLADGNTFACASCHALSEPAADGYRRAGHPIGDATKRTRWKNGEAPALLAAVNSCLTEWMAAPAWTAQEPRFAELVSFLDETAAAQGASAPAANLTFEIVPPPSALSGGDAIAGHALFNTSCSLCHGKDGAGAPQGPNLAGTQLSADYIARRIRTSGSANSPVYDGLTGGRMPFWAKDRLSDAELLDLIAYVATSKAPPMDAGSPNDLDGGNSGEVDAGTMAGADGGSPGCGSTHARIGWSTQLSTKAHGVSGKVTLVDDCTLKFEGFNYDGNGIDVRIYAAKGGNYTGGFPIGPQLYRPGQPYVNHTFTVTLPEGKTLDDLDGVSIWCVAVGFSFGDGLFAP